MLVLAAAASAAAVALFRTGRALDRMKHDATVRGLISTFAPAIAAVHHDPRELMAWYPIAQASRKLFPHAFRELDEASGRPFPFSKEDAQRAHARWSADWLAWERAHDAEYSLKAAQAQEELSRAVDSPLLRARLAAIEQEKLQRYQHRYEVYIRTAKTLASFFE
jgi:hypothetical protein